ncbi:TadE family type IV pilus minor pilin [Arthrobacter sp. CAN_A1]|uniref:TadE family type IV pilus minor pilin n=1 Tax=Arthrobacter sp. CAN_A1 TaxID=2787717 RepID=UPI001A1D4E4F
MLTPQNLHPTDLHPTDLHPTARCSSARRSLVQGNTLHRTIRQRGAVTAEVAVALPSLVLLLALLLGAATAGVTQLRLEEAARAGAREVARGEPAGRVQATVYRLAGGQARVELTSDGGWSTVTVSSRLAVPLLDLVGWDLSASASAHTELLGTGW